LDGSEDCHLGGNVAEFWWLHCLNFISSVILSRQLHSHGLNFLLFKMGVVTETPSQRYKVYSITLL